MSHEHNIGCDCSIQPNSTTQTLSELDFERGIWTAAINDDFKKVEQLLKNGHDPNKKDNSGYTALHYAARGGYSDILMKLLSHGAEPNSQTPSGRATPLHRAAYMGHYDSVKILLKNGAHPELVDSDGMSALHKCAEKGHYMCAELILNTAPYKFSELVKLRNNKSDTVYDTLVARNDENLEKWAELLSK